MVQDYFKYDKIQAGASLVINANDGTKTQEKLGLPLGIKSTAQGIQHFTNWNDISSSIDAKNTLRFEDSQPNKLFYKTNKTRAASQLSSSMDTTGAYNVSINTPNPVGDRTTEFIDEWHVDDIKILDDIAVVSYPDYTDIQRTEKTFTGIQMTQPVQRTYVGSYSEANTSFTWYGGLIFSIDGLPLMHQIFPTSTVAGETYLINDTTGERLTGGAAAAAQVYLDNKFYSLENTILKIKVPTNTYGDERYLYFIYGGATSSTDMPRQSSPNADGSFTFDDFRFSNSATQYANIYTGEDANRQWYNFDDGDFAGHFYIVTEESSTLGKDYSFERNPSGNIHIQLAVKQIVPDNVAYDDFISKYQSFNDGYTVQHVGYVPVGGASAEATFIKFTPVRQCGKVEVYTKKSGIISSAINNRITSPGHTLQTNDIIKITSALWDGTQTGAKDTHPLNGNKFVKVVDSDTFDLFEDQYFTSPCTTTKLKSTDGISWVCIGSSNSNEAQSWKYNQTLYSPTGRNGYRSTTSKYKTTTRYGSAYLCPSNADDIDLQNNCLYMDFSVYREATTTSTSLLYQSGRNWGIYNTDGSQRRYPNAASLYTQANKLGEMLRNFLDSVPVKDLGESPLDAFHKGPQDFFPFNTADFNSQFNPPYIGTRFGASMDLKFSHTSGNSKVYTLVVGEPGADISVDMFGLTNDEYLPDGNIPFWLQLEPGSTSFPSEIANIGRKRVMPYYQPNGKVHVFTVTVDQYGRISDITAQNTLFGDGSSVNNTCSNEEHPWETFMDLVRTNNYIGVDTNTGRRQMQSWSYDDGTWDTSYTGATNGSKASNIYMNNIAPFYEVLPDESSLYWDRAAIANWFGVAIYDYFSNIDSIRPAISRTTQFADRNRVYTDTTRIAYSRFGTGLGQSVIDRFNTSNQLDASQFYIMPWVDMFGKSVAVSNTNSDGEILVFGSASVRSNIDYHSVPRDRYSVSGSYGETAFRPVYVASAGINSSNADEYTISQMGQISCIRIDKNSTYNTTQIVEINAGGSVDSSTTPVDSGEVFERDTTSGPIFTIKELRTGEKLGSNWEPIVRSLRASALSIVFQDGHLFWAEHNLNSQHTKLHMMEHVPSNNSFTSKALYTHDFVRSYIGASVFGDEGFGNYISYDDGILVTNSLVSSNNFGVPVNTLSNIDTYDGLFALSATDKGITFYQFLTPTFTTLDERYTKKLLSDYEDSIIDIGNINYENHTWQSHTWNIRLIDKYSTIAGKIILKDPIEYVLFGLDHTFNNISKPATRTYTKDLDPYFGYTEIFTDDEVYYDYATESPQDTQYKVLDQTLWDNISATSFQNTDSMVRTPVIFLSIPSDSIDLYGNLTITLNKETIGRTYGSYWNIDSLGVTNIADNYNALTPKIALYRKDPRVMIVPNGPIYTDSNSLRDATYTDGIYNYDWSTFRNDNPGKRQTPATPPLFRGGANDLFHYSSNPASTPVPMVTEVNSEYDYAYARQYFNGETNLGELFDATYNQLGNINKGIISWFANDVRTAAIDAGVDTGVDAVPYGTIYSTFSSISQTAIRYTIPYSVWGQFVVDTNLVKNNNDDRPLFNDFTRIKHGSAGININPANGTWDYHYDDVNRATYVSANKTSNFTLMIGLVFTRNNTINQDGSVIYDPNTIYNLARFIGPKESNRQRYSSNYSYTPLIGGVYNASSTTNFTERAYINNLHLETNIDSINFDLSVTSSSKRRYRAKYHKIAYFEYNNEVYSDTQRNLLDSQTNDIERYAFGRYSFTPLPVGPLQKYNESTQVETATSKNPIIRVGKSKTSTQISPGNIGSFNDSIQVMASESVGGKNSVDTTYYANDDVIYADIPPSGFYIGTAYFANRSMIGGFDIEKPEGLSLFISAIPTEKESIPLLVRNQFGSGELTLNMDAYGFSSGITTLSIDSDNKVAIVSDLAIHGKNNVFSNIRLVSKGADIYPASGHTTLQTFGVVGSGIKKGTELFVSAPKEFPSDATLWIGRDIDNSGLVPLFINPQYVTPGGWTLSQKDATLNTTGSIRPNGFPSGVTPLYIIGPDEWVRNAGTGIPLYITTDIPESGNSGYWIGSGNATLAMVDDGNSGGIPLAIEAIIQNTGSIPLYIERAWANGITLNVRNQSPSGIIPLSMSGAFVEVGDLTLAISPPEASGISIFTRGYVE